MASSATFNTSNTNVKYRIDFDLLSQDVTNNTSLVRVRVFFWRTNTGYETYGSGSCTLTYNNGASSWAQTVTPSQKITSSGIYLFSLDMQFSHNSDGNRTVNLGAYINLPSILTSSEQRADFALPQIKRAAAITSVSAGGTFGSAITVNWSGNAAFTYDVIFTGSSGGAASFQAGSTSTYSYTPDLGSWLPYYPDTTTVGINIAVKTYYGETVLGISYSTIYQTVPASVAPTISTPTSSHVDIFPADPVPTGWGYVQTRSGITITATAAGAYGSTITAMTIGGGGYSNAAVSVSNGSGSRTFGALNTSGINTFTISVTDSRGRTASTTANITVNAYSRPQLSNVLTQRATSGGVQDSNGTYAVGKATYTFSAVGSNAVVRNVNYRESGATTWTDASVSFNSGTAFLIGGGFDVLKSYEIAYIVDDQFNTVIYTDVLSVATPILHFKKGGLMVAIGKRVSDFVGLDIGWPVRFSGDLSFTGLALKAIFLFSHPVKSIFITAEPENPGITYGGTWVAFGAGRVLIGMGSNGVTNYTTVEATGGSDNVSLTEAQLAAHAHGVLAATSTYPAGPLTGFNFVTNKQSGDWVQTQGKGSGSAHENRSSYVTVYMWKRTA